MAHILSLGALRRLTSVILAVSALLALGGGVACQATCPNGMYKTQGADGLAQYHCIVPTPPPAAAPSPKGVQV